MSEKPQVLSCTSRTRAFFDLVVEYNAARYRVQVTQQPRQRAAYITSIYRMAYDRSLKKWLPRWPFRDERANAELSARFEVACLEHLERIKAERKARRMKSAKSKSKTLELRVPYLLAGGSPERLTELMRECEEEAAK
jgi:hypothetical protein